MSRAHTLTEAQRASLDKELARAFRGFESDLLNLKILAGIAELVLDGATIVDDSRGGPGNRTYLMAEDGRIALSWVIQELIERSRRLDDFYHVAWDQADPRRVAAA